MFETMAAGRRARERESSRQTDVIGDEDAMVICLPPDAEGVLGVIVGHLNLISPWNPPSQKDDDFWNEPWHESMELGSRNADPDDDDLWIQGPSSHAYLGALDDEDDFDDDYDDGEIYPIGRADLLPQEIEEVPQFRARLQPSDRMMLRRDLRRACPGLYCTSPAYGYDLWQGTYEKEPAFWGKFSLSPMYGQSGPREAWSGDADSKAKHVRDRTEKRAENAAEEFERKARKKYGSGVVRLGSTVMVTFSAKSEVDKLNEIAKEASKRKGVYLVPPQQVTPATASFTFGTNPTTSGVGYSAGGVAALQVLLGALEGSIECGQVIPLGNGQFGVVGANVGKLFDFLKKKNKDDGEGEKGGKWVKKIDKLWEKIQKFNEKYKAESGKEHTPWQAAQAAASGFWGVSVGHGGGGHYWGQPEGMAGYVEIGRGGGGRGGHSKARQRLQKIRQKRQSRKASQEEQQTQPAPEAIPYQPQTATPSSPWVGPTNPIYAQAQQQQQQQRGGKRRGGQQAQAPAPQPVPQFQPQFQPQPMLMPQPQHYPMPVMPFGYGSYGSYGGMPMAMVRGMWGEPIFQDAPAAAQSPWEGGSGLRIRRGQFDGASAAGFWTDCRDDQRGIWRNSRNWDGQ